MGRFTAMVACLAAGTAGGAAALVLAGPLGLLQTSTTIEQVAAPPPVTTVTASLPAATSRPRGFDPVAVYRARARGVVTLEAWFGQHPAATGSGFVVDARRGLLLTNSHVVTNSAEASSPDRVRQADRVYVQLADGERAAARVVGFDLFDDVAVVRVDPADLPLHALPLGSARNLRVGDWVAAIGSPFNEEGSLSVGVVSQLGRQIPAPAGVCFRTVGAIQTDAAINHGNSGGPLFDARGRVVGINAQIDSAGGGGQGVGFAVPIDAARRSLRQLVRDGRVRYAWLGVSTETPVSRALARRFGLPVAYGALVQGVAPGGAAHAAGLTAGGRVAELDGQEVHPDGDLIVRFGSHPVHDLQDLQEAVLASQPGERVTVRFWRAHVLRSVQVVMQERPLTVSGGCERLR